MLEGFVSGLFTAFILLIFEVNKMLLEVAQPYIKDTTLTDSHYYILFGLIGLVGGAFSKQI